MSTLVTVKMQEQPETVYAQDSEGFESIKDPSKPEIRTLDPQIVKIGDLLQVTEEPDLPHGSTPVPKPTWQSKLPFFILVLGLGYFLFPKFFKKKGKK